VVGSASAVGGAYALARVFSAYSDTLARSFGQRDSNPLLLVGAPLVLAAMAMLASTCRRGGPPHRPRLRPARRVSFPVAQALLPAGPKRHPTHRDAWRTLHQRKRPDESGRGRLRVCATAPV